MLVENRIANSQGGGITEAYWDVQGRASGGKRLIGLLRN